MSGSRYLSGEPETWDDSSTSFCTYIAVPLIPRIVKVGDLSYSVRCV
jgi:hypothetical protein